MHNILYVCVSLVSRPGHLPNHWAFAQRLPGLEVVAINVVISGWFVDLWALAEAIWEHVWQLSITIHPRWVEHAANGAYSSKQEKDKKMGIWFILYHSFNRLTDSSRYSHQESSFVFFLGWVQPQNTSKRGRWGHSRKAAGQEYPRWGGAGGVGWFTLW